MQVVGLHRQRRFHRNLGGYLKKVGHDHVEKRPGLVVELRPIVNIESLGNVNLHCSNVLTVPSRIEQSVAEAQRMQILRAFFAEEVVDAKDLVLLEHSVHRIIQLPKVRGGCAEGFLVDDT